MELDEELLLDDEVLPELPFTAFVAASLALLRRFLPNCAFASPAVASIIAAAVKIIKILFMFRFI